MSDCYCFVARKRECGCIVGVAAIGCPGTAEMAGDWLADGLRVEREPGPVSIGARCPHGQQDLPFDAPAAVEAEA